MALEYIQKILYKNIQHLVSLMLTVPVKFSDCLPLRFYLRCLPRFLHTLYRKSNLFTSEQELCGLNSNSYILLCLWGIYIFPGSVHIVGSSKIDRLILEIYKSLTYITVIGIFIFKISYIMITIPLLLYYTLLQSCIYCIYRHLFALAYPQGFCLF
jgi:hypothetical protein